MTPAPGGAGGALFRLLLPSSRADPSEVYRQIRTEGPSYVPGLGAWVLAEHAHAAEALRHPGLSASFRLRWHRYAQARRTGAELEALSECMSRTLLYMDGPTHLRLRALLSRPLARVGGRALVPLMRETASALWDGIDRSRPFDFVEAFAERFPFAVVCHLLGIPRSLRAEVHERSRQIAGVVEPMLTTRQISDAVDASGWLLDCLRSLHRHGGDERDGGVLLRELREMSRRGDDLDEDQLVSLGVLLLIAGHETMTGLLSAGVLSLLEQGGRSRPGAVDELLRIHTPVQLTTRVAVADCRIAGRDVGAGDAVVVLLAAANRDPARFGEPDRMAPGRHGGAHLAFGFGSHYCLGASLARLEARTALEVLAPYLPRLAVESPPRWRSTVTMRSLRRLSLRLAD